MKPSTVVDVRIDGVWRSGFEVRRRDPDGCIVFDRAEGFFEGKRRLIPHKDVRLPRRIDDQPD